MNMKKTLIAAGVAAAMAVPMAATADVSLTARLQAELTNTSGDFDEGLRIGDAMIGPGNVNSGNWSRVDLRTSHDLGNGLNAFSHISMNLNPQSFPSATRESLLGVRGDFGSLSIGRMSNAAATQGKDPFVGTFMQARGNGGMLGGAGGLGNGGYLNQSLGYNGSFGPVGLGGTVSLDPVVDDGNHAYAVKVEVDVNPVNVWVAHTNADDYNGVDADQQISKIGVSFSEGPFGVMAQYETVKDFMDFIMVAGTYRMGANTFLLGYGQGDADFDGGDQQWIALGVRHAFTRQVSVHAGVRVTEFAEDDADETVVGAGMRVTF
ncbi:porin [Thioalkalivibrio thiocyanodenitrificans]|uniref:porin n=1 Tax=Thioalkalivibrio thiocyanodenitrificans TaxID=243063 RepID=UPI0003707085|nr:porin [Thioalkalivibrio thiocyanodenitrificans]